MILAILFDGDVANRKLTRFNQRNCTVKCVCGAEILLMPDAEAMSRAIEAHVDWHVKKSRNPSAAAAEAERIRDVLISQVLSLASELGNNLSDE